MAKISKEQSKRHAEACDLLKKDRLSIDDRVFVLKNWREDATHMNGALGAFFTPSGLARDLSIEITGCFVVDLCAGIGELAFAAWIADPNRQITCIEINPEYLAVGKKVLPEATWVRADVFDYHPVADFIPTRGEHAFDCAISNPPYGRVKTHKNEFGYFEYDLIAHAAKIATDGVFLIPQMSVPFKYSNHTHFERNMHERYAKFNRQTGIDLSMNCGLDTSAYQDEWTIKPPVLEIALGFKEEL